MKCHHMSSQMKLKEIPLLFDVSNRTNTQTHKQTNTQTHKQTNRQTDKQTNKQTDKQTNKQPSRQTDKQQKYTFLTSQAKSSSCIINHQYKSL